MQSLDMIYRHVVFAQKLPVFKIFCSLLAESSTAQDVAPETPPNTMGKTEAATHVMRFPLRGGVAIATDALSGTS